MFSLLAILDAIRALPDTIRTLRNLRLRHFAFGGLAAILLVAGLGWLGAQQQAANRVVSAERTAWCLSAGRGNVDVAVEVMDYPRTWTDETATTDPNFAEACNLAWTATHD